MKLTCSAFARHSAAAVLLAGVAIASVALAQDAAPSLAGTWKLVPEKSKFADGSTPQSLTLTIPASGDPVMTVEGMDAKGQPVKETFQSIVDGKPHPISGLPNADSGIWSRNSDLNSSYRYLKGKSIAVLGTRTLSADGSTLTFREQTYDDRGKQLGATVITFVNPEVKVAPPPPPPGSTIQMVAGPSLNADETAASDALTKGDDDAAIKMFTTIISGKQTPMFFYDHVSRGIAYARKGMQKEAIADFDEALKEKPDYIDAHFRRGGAHTELQQYKEAIEDLSAVVEAQPDNAAAFSLRSFAYYKLNDSAHGGADIEKACMLDMKFCP